ncbi:MAG: DUF2865 domain-containing protein [Hyphomicrobium sp.]
MRFKTFVVRLLACLLLAGVPLQTAQAESFFQKLFGWGSGSSAKPSSPAVAKRVPSLGSFSRSGSSSISHYQPDTRYSDEADVGEDANGAYRTLCVRTCDGYYFPISSRASSRRFSRDARQCMAMCGSEAKLFYLPRGSDDVKNMTDISGRVYNRLPTAFAYRKSLINGCTCKPMPWSAAEAARHDQYDLIETLDKAQEHNAELARAAAVNQAGEGETPTSATIAMKQAESLTPAEPAPVAHSGASPIVIAAADPEPEQQPEPLQAAREAAPPAIMLGHLLPDQMQVAMTDDTVITVSPATKRPRRGAAFRSAKHMSDRAGQKVSWFTPQPKYSWPGDAPVRRR